MYMKNGESFCSRSDNGKMLGLYEMAYNCGNPEYGDILYCDMPCGGSIGPEYPAVPIFLYFLF